MKKLMLITLLGMLSTPLQAMTFSEFVTSFKEEVGEKIHKGKTYLQEKYAENKEDDSEHAVVDTAQDAVVDSAKAIGQLSKEAYHEAKTLYQQHKDKEANEPEQSQLKHNHEH
jgi:hypothetical protein